MWDFLVTYMLSDNAYIYGMGVSSIIAILFMLVIGIFGSLDLETSGLVLCGLVVFVLMWPLAAICAFLYCFYFIPMMIRKYIRKRKERKHDGRGRRML